MRLLQITENEYDGLEDHDEFEEPYPHFGDCVDCTYPVLDPDINDQEDDRAARQSRWCTKCGYAVCLDCVHGTADYITCGSCNSITESEYDGLEDHDEFGTDLTCMYCGLMGDDWPLNTRVACDGKVGPNEKGLFIGRTSEPCGYNRHGHMNCILQTPEDKQKYNGRPRRWNQSFADIFSSGWSVQKGPKWYHWFCPDCTRENHPE